MPIRDTRMMARALTQRWPIKPEIREAIVKRLLRVIADPQSSPREVTAAARALMSAEAQNQSDEHKVLDVEHATARDTQLSAIAADLGIDPRLIVDASNETDRGIEGVKESTVERRS
jgi:hypothetical protein